MAKEKGDLVQGSQGLHFKCQSFARASGHREIDLSEWLPYIFTTCTYGIWQWLPRSSFWTFWLVLFPPSSSSDFFKYNVFKHIHSPVCNSYDHPLLSDTCHASSVCMNSVSWLRLAMCRKASWLGSLYSSESSFSLLYPGWFSEKQEGQRPRVNHWRCIWCPFCREQIWNRRKVTVAPFAFGINQDTYWFTCIILVTKKKKKKSPDS